MENKNLINKIKDLMVTYGFLNEKEEITEEVETIVNVEFTDVKTSDGTMLKVNGDIAVGNDVMVVTEEGEIPAPDGEYELEDGTKFMVANGKIESIGEPEVEPEMEPEVEPSVGGEMDEIFEMLKKFIESVTEKMSTMNEKMSATEQELSEVKNEFTQFKKEPAGVKIPDGKVENIVEESKVEKILRLRNKK